MNSLDALRASIARLEARAKKIPAWKLGTIVFADSSAAPSVADAIEKLKKIRQNDRKACNCALKDLLSRGCKCGGS